MEDKRRRRQLCKERSEPRKKRNQNKRFSEKKKKRRLNAFVVYSVPFFLVPMVEEKKNLFAKKRKFKHCLISGPFLSFDGLQKKLRNFE